MIEDKDLYIQKLEKKIKKLKKKNKILIKINNELASQIPIENVIENIKNSLKEIKEKNEELLKSREDLKEEFNNKFLLKIKQFKEENEDKNNSPEENYTLKIKLPEFKSDKENIETMKSMIGEIRLINNKDFNSEGEENGNQ
jgi:hypothetical protein